MQKLQKFKGEQLTRTRVKNNILKVWAQCTEEDKFDWYRDASGKAVDLACAYYEDLFRVIGVIAALSPRKKWGENLRIAEEFISGNQRDGLHMKMFQDKAARIMEANNEAEVIEILGGQKIISFYLNIMYFEKSTCLTIDRHAISIAVNKKLTSDSDLKITLNQYEFIQQCYIWTANQLDISPLLLQSATWERWRKN